MISREILISLDFVILAFLGLLSGFSSAWLGAGGSVFIVPLLPFLSGLSAVHSLQVSLLLIVTISFINSIAFILQKLVLWGWFVKASFLSLSFAFLSGGIVSYLSSFQIRFILWLFLLIILLLPWLLSYIPLLKKKGFYLFSSLMGICSGLTGLGGGMILSPFLHESEMIPPKNIPALVSCIMFFVSGFSLLGQFSQTELFFASFSKNLFFYYILLLIPSFVGLFIGYFVNVQQKDIKLRRLLLRLAVVAVFLKMTIEIFISKGQF